MKERSINDIIRIISISSFIFAVLNSIFSLFGMESANNYLFIWISTNLLYFYLMNKKKDHWKYISPLVMLLPVVFLREVHEFLFLALVVLLAQFFLQGRIDYRYSTVTEEFRKNVLVLAVIYGFSMLVGAMSLFGKYVAPYIFIYLITSIVLLRTLRYMENMGNAEKINKINLRATLGIIILSMGTSNEWVLKILKSILVTIKAGYDRVINFIFAWLVVPLAYLMDRYFRFDLRVLREGKDDPEQIGLSGILELRQVSISVGSEAAELINQLILNMILAILIIGVIYIIYRIYAKQAQKEIIAGEYVESKEFIFKERKKEEGFFRRLTNFIKPKSNEEKIRLYYKKFLENCQEYQIEIRGSDTSLDVSKKAQYIFDPIIMEKMRKIYIRVRYGQQKVNTSTYEEFKGYYKELNRIAKNKSS